MLKQIFVAILFAVTFSAGIAHADNTNKEEAAAEQDIRAVNAWTKETSDKSALVYVEIENASDKDVVLTGGETTIADSVEVVGVQMQDGEPAYTPFPAFPVGAGLKVALTPDAIAIRLNNLVKPLEKDETFDLTLVLDKVKLLVKVKIESADAKKS